MCTSFVKATDNNRYIAMNFDNNGLKHNVSTRKKGWFIVYIDTGKGKRPSFGVHQSGLFFNALAVAPCEKGKYRRGKGVVHSERFIKEIIDGKIHVDDLEQYLQNTKIVNVPDWSVHSLLCGTKNDVWIVEPGRGNIHTILKSNEFKLMTNFSLIDSIQGEETISCKRYNTANRLLSNTDGMSVSKAFEILQATKQSGEGCPTEFSMVYDDVNKTVYYCYNQDFINIKEFLF